MGGSILDADGFVKDLNLWTEDIALEIAKKQFNFELTESHMNVVRFVREYYLKWGAVPMIKVIKDKVNLTDEKFNTLFNRTRASTRGMICKIAGLPRLLCIGAGC